MFINNVQSEYTYNMAELSETEATILHEALNTFRHQTGLDMEVTFGNIQIMNPQNEAVVRIKGDNRPFVIEIKKWAAHANLGAIINKIYKIKNIPMDALLVADYVNPNMAAKLFEKNVQFIDTVGNAYINRLPIYIYVKGNRKKDEGSVIQKEGTGRAFSTTGLKVVYVFLCNPNLINATYRKIADVADVALGTVGWVLNDLKGLRFVIGRGRVRNDRHLRHHRKLLERWVEAYPEKLRRKQRVGDFVARDPFWWKDVNIGQYQAQWGGEIAAARYTNNYLRPEEVTLYLPKQMENRFLAEAKLRRATEWVAEESNRVKIYRPFWRAQQNKDHLNNKNPIELVHPILAYADLIATADARNIEAAKMIYERHIAEYIRED